MARKQAPMTCDRCRGVEYAPREYTVELCPLHAAAERMRGVLDMLREAVESRGGEVNFDDVTFCAVVANAIAEAHALLGELPQ
jgi:hypothetical protein